MSRYFTSDLHFGSSLINKYAHRPFTSAEEAVKKLTETINSMLTPTDSLIHVGDFMLTGKDQHGNEIDVGLDFDRDNYLRILKTRVVLLSGNHDDGHNCEADCRCMIVDLNHNYKNVTVGHVPSNHPDYQGLIGTKKSIHIHLCGHVHDKWLFCFDKSHYVLNINVGVDVWDYKPVRDSEVTNLLDYIHAYLWTKICYGDRFLTYHNFSLTRNGFNEFVKSHEIEQKKLRALRKEERHTKKGLTPEECERRKQEGMKLAKLVKELRSESAAGITACRDALLATNLDKDQAKVWLNERGLLKARLC